MKKLLLIPILFFVGCSIPKEQHHEKKQHYKMENPSYMEIEEIMHMMKQRDRICYKLLYYSKEKYYSLECKDK